MSYRKKREQFFKYDYKHIEPKKRKMSNEDRKKPIGERDEHYLRDSYRISMHCIVRCNQRVFSNFEYINGARAIRIAKFIRDNLDFNIETCMDGQYPFLDRYYISVIDNVALTIKPKEFNKRL